MVCYSFVLKAANYWFSFHHEKNVEGLFAESNVYFLEVLKGYLLKLLTIDLLCQIMRLLNDLLSHQKALLISFIYEVLNHQNFRLDHKILPIVMLKNLTLLLCHFGVLFGILFLYFFVEFKSLADEPQLAF